jgi:hypothetical protein
MKKTNYYIIIIITILLLLFFINYFFLYSDIIEENTLQYNLPTHGFQIYPSVFSQHYVNHLKKCCEKEEYKNTKQDLITNKGLLKLIHNELNDAYTFQDYIWIIKKSVVHTCHRDNNGDFFNDNQKYPSYTMLIYLEDMEKCLGVIPTSHKDMNSYAFNITDKVINLPCKPGDVILFNANLIHVGCINKKDDNLRIQLKVTHREDIPHIQYYQNFNKILNKDNHLPGFLRKAQRKITCTIPALSDATQGENIRTARGSSNGIDIGLAQQMFSYLFYGNSSFYDLPNAF